MSTTPALVINGLVSGITTPEVIDALLERYQEPITDLEKEQSSLNQQADDYRQISTDLQGLLTAAQALSGESAWNLATSSTSDSAVAVSVASPGAETGSLTFRVNQLAQASILASEDGVASEDDPVTSASSVLLATGVQALGFSSLTPGSGLGLGSLTMVVTQASEGASVRGSGALASTTGISSSDDTLTLTVGGVAHTLTIASGTYTQNQLAAAVTQAAKTAGVALTVSLTTTDALELQTTEQGSAASLGVTGGTSLASLRLSAGESGVGTDAVVTIGGARTTLTAINPGARLTLNAPDGATLSATIGSASTPTGALVAEGTAKLANVSTGNGSLAAVVAAINGSGLTATAGAVKTASGDYILEVSAQKTGVANAVSVGSAAFSGSSLGALETVVSAQTAEVTVGGTHGYTLSSSTDSFTNLLQGTTVTVVSTGQATVTVTPDATGEATKVTALVTAANMVLSDIQRYAGYTTTTKTGGPLMGDVTVDDIKQQVLSVFSTASGSSSLGDLSAAGVTLTKTGTVSFTRTSFVKAFGADSSGVRALFTQDGSFSPSSSSFTGGVSFAFAGTTTPTGTYAVSVSHSAAQATDVGTARPTGTVTAAETLTMQSGSLSAQYTTTAGETLAEVAAGLNASLASAGIAVSAAVVGTTLELKSTSYGSAASFSVSSTASGTGTTGLGGPAATSPVTFHGEDVAGSIGGVAATGNGQELTAPNGLSVQVSATGISATTDLGTLDYVAGAAQQLETVADAASNPETGSITGVISSLVQEATGLDPQISTYEQMRTAEKTVLENEFARMEQALGKLEDEGSTLSSAIDKLATT